jgi:hypothetical protein
MSNNALDYKVLFSHPERTSSISKKATLKARLLALRSDTLIDSFSKPIIGLHIPRVYQNLEVFSPFDVLEFDVGGAGP